MCIFKLILGFENAVNWFVNVKTPSLFVFYVFVLTFFDVVIFPSIMDTNTVFIYVR